MAGCADLLLPFNMMDAGMAVMPSHHPAGCFFSAGVPSFPQQSHQAPVSGGPPSALQGSHAVAQSGRPDRRKRHWQKRSQEGFRKGRKNLAALNNTNRQRTRRHFPQSMSRPQGLVFRPSRRCFRGQGPNWRDPRYRAGQQETPRTAPRAPFLSGADFIRGGRSGKCPIKSLRVYLRSLCALPWPGSCRS